MEDLTKMEDLKLRIKWSLFNHYEPIRIIISNWKNLTIVKYGRKEYMAVDCIMEHGKHPIELLIPYTLFVRRLRDLRSIEQQLIIHNKAVVELEKTYKWDNYGMKIRRVEPLQESSNQNQNHS